MATKVSYRKIRSGCDEEFNNRRLFFVMVNKAKQEKGQVTLCFKCETTASSETRVVSRVYVEEIFCDGPGRFASPEL